MTDPVLMLALLGALAGAAPACAEPYPDDAFSCPSADRWNALETVTGVQPAGNPVQRLAQWERNDLRATMRRGLPWTAWRFVCRPGNGAVLCFSDRIRRLPSAVSVRVANLGTRPAPFAISMGEIPWVGGREAEARNWSVEGDGPVAAGAERVVRFDPAQLRADRPTPRARPAWPASINLHVGDPEAGVEYALDLREWTVYYPDAEGVRVTRLEAPGSPTPGTGARFVVEARGVRATARVDLELRARERVLWRLRLTGAEVRALAAGGRASLRRSVPWYLPGRDLVLGLVVDGYRAAGATGKTRVAARPGARFPRTERRQHLGRPTPFVNGRPLAWSHYSSYEYRPGNVAEFGASGANVFVVPVSAGRHMHQIAAPTWVAPGTYDFSEVDERVCMSLQANPDAYLCLRASLALPVWWLQRRPDCIARVRTAQGNRPGDAVEWEETGCLAASMADQQWQAQQEACLRALVAHCAAQPWASRVVGFMPTGGVTEEWFAWGCNDGLYADYSKADERAFAAWCEREGYPWKSAPLPQARQRAGWDYYPVDEDGRQAAAYTRYANELGAEVLCRFARAIKEATGGRCLVGAFHGYLIQLAGEPRQHLAAQFALGRLLDCPHFDFLAGIPLHNFRDLTNGYDTYCSATESILAAGKLVMNENDLFSWLHHAIWHTLYDPEDPRGGALSMHRRVLADDLVHGTLRGWFSLLASWHHDPGLQAEFAGQVTRQASGVNYDRTGVEQVALVVDDSTFNWLPPETRLTAATHPGLLYALARTGAPVGVWLARDLDRLPARIKLVVIAEATAARSADVARIGALLREGGRTVVAIGAPGLIEPERMRWRPDAPGALLGLPVRVNEAGGTGEAAPATTGEAICGVPQVRPRAEGSGTGWLRFSDGATAGLERALPAGGRLIWCAVPPQVSTLTRAWMEQAGVHCYAPPGFTVHASRELVAITAAGAGEVELKWPEAARATDLFDGWEGQGTAFRCPFAAGQTRLFHVMDPERG